MKLYILKIFLVLSCLISQQYSAFCSSPKAIWSYKIISQNKQKVELLFSIQIADNYFVYDSISNITDVDAIQFNFPQNVLIKVGRNKLKVKTIHDNLFTNRKIKVLHNQNYFIVIINSTKNQALIPCKITYAISGYKEFFILDTTLQIKLMETSFADSVSLKIPYFNLNAPLHNDSNTLNVVKNSGNTNYWNLFLIGLIGGLIALLTPCVFPMIPFTISFFSKSTRTKKQAINNALFYGLSIVLIYFIVSLPFHLVHNISPDILNKLATNAYLNFAFFAIMIIFGISFLGAFEIQLPSKLINFSDSKSTQKNNLGIFFMALTLCIVSFSCTGPLLGTLLVNTLSTSNGATALTFALIGFGIGMGLPFALLSLFPNLLKALPKSGAWMTELKVFLGFIEFALALKFLSNVDLVLHWGLLKREIFLAIWATLCFAYFLYLIKIYQILKNQHVQFSITKKIYATLVLCFCIYLSFGVSKAGYKKIEFYNSFSNGILPPYFYSIYAKDNNCILGLTCVKDYDEAVKLAKKLHKSILLDFTGWACVNCRKMEENVWSNESVNNILKEHFIIASLYVDDRKKLPAIIGINDNKFIETIGEKWSNFQIINFKNNAQPLYAIINEDQQLINTPIGYTPNIETYKTWLLESLQNNN